MAGSRVFGKTILIPILHILHKNSVEEYLQLQRLSCYWLDVYYSLFLNSKMVQKDM
jgi:hypothetical protein